MPMSFDVRNKAVKPVGWAEVDSGFDRWPGGFIEQPDCVM